MPALVEHDVEITGLSYGGRGIGRIAGKVVFVPFTAPGDKARVRVTREKKGFSEGALVEVLTPSRLRAAPVCGVYGLCGGCSLQHMSYDGQLEWKQRIFLETLKRIGRAAPSAVDPPIASPEPFNYRLRARVHVEGRKWGFYAAGSHRVVDIEDCPVLAGPVNDTFRAIKGLFLSDAGRSMEAPSAVDIGLSPMDGKTVAAFHVSGKTDFPWRMALDASSLLKGVVVRSAGKERAFEAGDTAILYDVAGLRMSAGIGVFTQANLSVNRALVDRAVEYAAPRQGVGVLDLFSGAGNLTLPLALGSKKTVGVESDPEAAGLARENARLNGLRSVECIHADAGEWLSANLERLKGEGPPIVVLDPPRGGDPELAGTLARLRPPRIVYVSCNPPTLARDVSILAAGGYALTRAGILDMFPQTYHIEGIISLELAPS
jgi:23S rRNA (uracil1939-C5)-methyltransferase